jgi:long-chain acyl-CoA synthetase
MMREKDLGIWREYSWNRVGQRCARSPWGWCSAGLRARRGRFGAGQHLGVEWVLADLGILCAGGVSRHLPDRRAAQVALSVHRFGARAYLFVEDEEQLDKVLEVRERCRSCAQVVVYDMEGLAAVQDDPQVISLERCASWAAPSMRRTSRQLIDHAAPARQPDDLAILVYTSGTTGKPKGAMITCQPGALRWTCRQPVQGLPRGRRAHVLFAAVPHRRTADRRVRADLCVGSIVNFVENPETVFENVREISAARVLRRAAGVGEDLLAGDDHAEGGQPPSSSWPTAGRIGIGAAGGRARAGRQPVPGGTAGHGSSAWQTLLVLNNVRRALGLTGCAGADRRGADLARPDPLVPGAGHAHARRLGHDRDLRRRHHQSAAGRHAPGSIGPPGPGRRGDAHRPGDRRDPAARPQCDRRLPEPARQDRRDHRRRRLAAHRRRGPVDDDGYFRITDRMKDIIITAGGKNITPSEWENELKFSPYMTDAVVIGDKRAYLTWCWS